MTCLSSFAFAQTSEDDPNGTEVGATPWEVKGYWEVVVAKQADGSPDITGSSEMTRPHMTNLGVPFIQELSTTNYAQRYQETSGSIASTLSSPIKLSNHWRWHWRVQFVRDNVHGQFADVRQKVYIKLTSEVQCSTSTGSGAVPMTAVADCGLQGEITSETSTPLLHTMYSAGIRYLMFQPVTSMSPAPNQVVTVSAMDIYVDQASYGETDYRYPFDVNLDHLGSVIHTNSCTAEISDRSVAVVFDNLNTMRRRESVSGVGQGVLNEMVNGNSFQDTVMPPRDVLGLLKVSSSAQRLLGGGWPTDSDELFNEWWVKCKEQEVHVQDTALWERVGANMSYEKQFGFDDVQWETWLKQFADAPLIVKYVYQATETAKGITGEAIGILRVHLPAENVRIEDTWPSTYRADEAPVKFSPSRGIPTVIGGVENGSNSQTIPGTTTVTQVATTSYGSEWCEGGAGQVGPDYLRYIATAASTRTSATTYSVGTTIGTEVQVPPHYKVEFVAHAHKRMDRWIASTWGANGFIQDAFYVDSGEPWWNYAPQWSPL